MPKILFAILSCHSLQQYEPSLRETWIKELPGIDHKFFLGLPSLSSPLLPDEVLLEVDDSFQGITEKSVAMHRWALEHGYDYVVKVDLDTFVRPVELLQSGFEQFDYTGGQNTQGVAFASGGSGYWLSRRALQIVVDAKITPGPAEDLHVATVLNDQGITLHADNRYQFIPGDIMNDRTLTLHLSSVKGWSAKASPSDMHQAYAESKSGVYRPLPVVVPERRFQRLRRA